VHQVYTGTTPSQASRWGRHPAKAFANIAALCKLTVHSCLSPLGVERCARLWLTDACASCNTWWHLKTSPPRGWPKGPRPRYSLLPSA